MLNGRLPDTMLVHLPWPEAARFRLRADAAAAAGRMAAAFEHDLGYPLRLTDAYRDFAGQVAVKASKPTLATTPGTSVHGWGLAIDAASGINAKTSRAHRWMDVNAWLYGWINPAWAIDYNPRNGAHEPWHWEYHPELDDSATATAQTPTALTPEDDMFDAPDREALAVLVAQVKEIRGALGAGGGDTIRLEDTIGYRVHDIQAALTTSLPVLLASATAPAVVAAIPDAIAREVADLLARRLAA